MTTSNTASGPHLPTLYPSSMLLEAIEDSAVRALLDEEDTLRARRNALRAEVRQVQDSKIQVQRTLQPLVNDHMTTTAAAVDALQKRKDALYSELEQLRHVQDVAAQARSELRGLTAESRELRSAVSAASLLLRDEQKEMDYLQRSRNGMSGNNSNSSEMNAKIAAQQKRVTKYQSLLRDRSSELQAKEAELEQRRTSLQPALEGANTAEQSQRFSTLRQELDVVQSQLAAARRRRQEERPDTSALREVDMKLDTLHSALRDVEQRLQHIHEDVLPCLHFTYAPGLRSELIGRGGATLRQLQLDFGVALCLDTVPNGHGFIVGSTVAMQRCKDAIDTLLQQHPDSSEEGSDSVVRTESMPFDATLTRQVVGPQGSHIAGLERESGARLKIQKNQIEITGTNAALIKARTLLEAFFASFTTASMSFEAAELPIVLGRAGATIQRIQRESGVRGLKVNRVQHTLTATGSAEAVGKALAMYKELLHPTTSTTTIKEIEKNTSNEKKTAAGVSDFTRIVLHGDDHLIRRVIGTRGSKVKEIEAVSGAHVSCEAGETITLSGTASAVRTAQGMINQLRQSEAIVKVEPEMVRFLHAAIVRDDMDDEEESEEESEGSEGDDPLTSTPLSSRIPPPQQQRSSSASLSNASDQPATKIYDDEAEKDTGNDIISEEQLDEEATTTTKGKRPHYQQRPHKPRYLSPLKAIQRVTRCDMMQWRAAESVVVLRGYQESVARAETMLRQLLLLNHPHSETLPYSPVLRPLLLLTPPRTTSRPSSTSASNTPTTTPHKSPSAEHHRMSPLEALRAAYSPLLQIDVDQTRHVLRVSSQDAKEVQDAVQELRTLVQTLTARHVRCLSNVPLSAIRLLIGPRGETVRGIEHGSETEVTVIRWAKTAEVQVLSRRGCEEDLNAALDMIRTAMKLKENNDKEGEDEVEKAEEGDERVKDTVTSCSGDDATLLPTSTTSQ